jgi:type II secretory pathway component PulF
MDRTEIIAVLVAIVLGLALSSFILVVARRLRLRSESSLLRDILDLLGLLGRVLLIGSLFVVLLGLAGPVGLLWWVVAIYVLIEGVRNYRATQQYGLLWLLTVSAERSMPLTPAIEAFARERRGTYGQRAKRLAALLNSGLPLPDALDRCPGLLPAQAAPMVRVGYETGTLAAALRQAATHCDFQTPVWAALTGKISYLLLAPVFGTSILIFIMIKIVPSFEKIFKDFGATLPTVTQCLVEISSVFVCYWYLFAPFYLLAIGLLMHAVARYFGWSQWDPPGIARLTRRLDSARILDTLALVARQQRPLWEGIAALAQSYPKSDIRRRLSQAMGDIQAGGDWCESLRRRDLIRQPELAILQAAQRVGNLSWALHEMADSTRRRLGYRVQAIAQFLFPPIVICMGLIVMFIVVALFLPLIALIQRLA